MNQFAENNLPPLEQRELDGIRHPFWLRPDTTDAYCLKQIFDDDGYLFDLESEPNIIIDAGANIGFASIFFANRYPDARILAIEPETSNFAILERNVAAYEHVQPIQAAIWHENKKIAVTDPELGEWGYRTESRSVSSSAMQLVPGRTIESIMSEYDLSTIDILKVDIEGAEKPMFENSSEWIHAVHMIVVELHDRFTPGCSESFETATSDLFPKRWWQGENLCVSR